MPDRVLAALSAVPFLLGAAAAPDRSGEVAFTFRDPAIVEASALVVEDGLVMTSNDSGDSGRVFAVDPTTGETVGVTHWADDPTDVESLAPGGVVDGTDTVWVGDIGDNGRSRSTVQVARVPVGRGERTVRPTVYDLAYPDGPHDAETLVRDPTTGRLYVASKEVLGGALYALPEHLSADHVNELTEVGPVLPIATDGAFLPDGRHLVVRNYTSASVYDWSSLQRVATLALPAQPQGEGLGIGPDGEVLLDSEGVHSRVLRLVLPARIRQLIGLDPSPSASPSAGSPAGGSAGPSATATGAPAGPASRSATDHSASWLVGGLAVAVAAVAVVVGMRRRSSRVE